jgi:hypothetical protein
LFTLFHIVHARYFKDLAVNGVVPHNLVDFVAEEGAEHERMETWIAGEVERGARLPGLYPMNESTRVRYETAKRRAD